MRQMVHINWEVKLNKCERILIESNDAEMQIVSGIYTKSIFITKVISK